MSRNRKPNNSINCLNLNSSTWVSALVRIPKNRSKSKIMKRKMEKNQSLLYIHWFDGLHTEIEMDWIPHNTRTRTCVCVPESAFSGTNIDWHLQRNGNTERMVIYFLTSILVWKFLVNFWSESDSWACRNFSVLFRYFLRLQFMCCVCVCVCQCQQLIKSHSEQKLFSFVLFYTLCNILCTFIATKLIAFYCYLNI